jgi:hypothetical protein
MALDVARGGAKTEVASLYIDLIKRVLTDSIHADDPLAGFDLFRPRLDRARWKNAIIGALERLLRLRQMRIVEARGEQDFPARAHTMIGLNGLENLQHCIETVLRENVPGDFIETGVWRGGACVFMRAMLAAYGDTSRVVWVADSFAGLPPPDTARYPADRGDRHHRETVLSVSRGGVENNFQSYGLLDRQVQFLEGWFKDTLPNGPINRLAIMRLDGDMYESTMQALEALYDKLSVGGFVIIDDYMLKPCAHAVHEFRERRKIEDMILPFDDFRAYWRRMS